MYMPYSQHVPMCVRRVFFSEFLRRVCLKFCAPLLLAVGPHVSWNAATRRLKHAAHGNNSADQLGICFYTVEVKDGNVCFHQSTHRSSQRKTGTEFPMHGAGRSSGARWYGRRHRPRMQQPERFSTMMQFNERLQTWIRPMPSSLPHARGIN